MSNVIQFRGAWVQPDSWTSHHKYLFDYYREYRGYTLDQARAEIEAMTHRERVVPGETDKERLLRMAQEEFASLAEGQG